MSARTFPTLVAATFVAAHGLGCAAESLDATTDPQIDERSEGEPTVEGDDDFEYDAEGKKKRKVWKYEYLQEVPLDSEHLWIPKCPDAGVLFSAIETNNHKAFDGKRCGFSGGPSLDDPEGRTCKQVVAFAKLGRHQVCWGRKLRVNCIGCVTQSSKLWLWRLEKR
jgi:hypothetical protein